MILFLWIIGIIAAIIAVKFVYLIIKRLLLIRKISKRTKMTWKRFPLASVFITNGKTDFTVDKGGKKIAVSIITTPFRRSRYHFQVDNGILEVMLTRRGMYMNNPRVQRGARWGYINVFTKKYKVDFSATCDCHEQYMIVHPAPIETSRAKAATTGAIGNGDELCKGIKICGAAYFVDTVIS